MLRAVLAVMFAVLLAALPLAAAAQSYRCVGKDGKKYYGQNIPRPCLGQPVEQLNAQGMVVKRIDAEASADDRAKKEADESERKKKEAHDKEEGRRDRALLATYTSVQEVDAARARALKENQQTLRQIEDKISALRKHQSELAKELAGAGKDDPPAKLKQEARNAEIDLNGQAALLAGKRKEADLINAKYDDEKKRYIEAAKRSR